MKTDALGAFIIAVVCIAWATYGLFTKQNMSRMYSKNFVKTSSRFLIASLKSQKQSDLQSINYGSILFYIIGFVALFVGILKILNYI